ncbi:MAG: hypothetical protein ACKPKO_55235, partial [Candidatus Fonsibacter sp.]
MVEIMRMVTSNTPMHERRSRLQYMGDNTSNAIVGVVQPSWDRVWQLNFQYKKDLYGHYIMAVGGKGSNHDRAMVESLPQEE